MEFEFGNVFFGPFVRFRFFSFSLFVPAVFRWWACLCQGVLFCWLDRSSFVWAFFCLFWGLCLRSCFDAVASS